MVAIPNFKQSILLVLILGQSYTQTCSRGCLKCKLLTSDQSECQICDLKNKYSLESTTNTCKQSSITNCEALNLSGSCFRCNTGYFFSNGQCTLLSESQKIPGCRFHENILVCSQCEATMYLSGNQCLVASPIVDNCAFYDSSQKCKLCAVGFKLNTLNDECLPITNLANCEDQTFYQCTECKQGHSSNPNIELFQQTTAENYKNFLHGLITVNTSYRQQCELLSPNCAQADVFGICTRCDAGYYLDDSYLCQKNPADRTNNCTGYDHNLECIECETNFYLQDKLCVGFPESYLNKCALLQKNGEDFFCQTCNIEFVRVNSNCEDRTDIVGCTTHAVNVNDCAECGENRERFELANKQVLCVVGINNCLKHVFNTNGEVTACQYCAEELRPDPEDPMNCIAGNIESCKLYSQIGDCRECITGSYLINNECRARSNQENCKDFAISQDHCKTCSDNYTFYSVKNRCVQNNVQRLLLEGIDNCQSLNSTDSNQCEQCEIEYMKIEHLTPNMCVQRHLLSLDKCFTENVTETEYECDTCDQEKSILKNLYFQQNPIQHCEMNIVIEGVDETVTDSLKAQEAIGCDSYARINQATPSCTKCPSDFYIVEDRCEEICTTTVDFQNQANKINFFSNCLAAVIEDNVITDLQSKGQMFNLIWENQVGQTCDSHQIKVIKPEQIEEFQRKYSYLLIEEDFRFSSRWISNSTYEDWHRWFDYQQETFCLDKQTFNVTEILNCDIYLVNEIIGNERAVNCYKCKQGFKPYYAVGDNTTTDFTPIISCEQRCEIADKLYYPIKINNIGEPQLFIDTLLSCHQCKDSKVMAYFIEFTQKGNDQVNKNNFFEVVQNSNAGEPILRFHPASLNANSFVSTHIEQSISNQFCVDNSSFETLGESLTANMTTTDDNIYVSNCGLYLIDIQYSRIEQLDNTKVVCNRCLPGYTPTYHTNKPFLVTACTKIENCSENDPKKLWNGCSYCKDGYIHKVFQDSIQFDCSLKVQDEEASLSQNCFAGQDESSNISQSIIKCRVCKKGFSFVENDSISLFGVCKKLEVPNCENFVFYDLNTLLEKQQNLEFNTRNNLVQLIHAYTYKNNGCQQCETNLGDKFDQTEISLFIVTDDQINFNYCLKIDEQPHEVHNCLIENEQGCVECLEGYGMHFVKGIFDCSYNYLQNCEKPEKKISPEIIQEISKGNLDTIMCHTCKDGYYLNTFKKFEKVGNRLIYGQCILEGCNVDQMDFVNNRCFGCESGQNYTLTNEGKCLSAKQKAIYPLRECGIYKDNECIRCKDESQILIKQTQLINSVDQSTGKVICQDKNVEFCTVYDFYKFHFAPGRQPCAQCDWLFFQPDRDQLDNNNLFNVCEKDSNKSINPVQNCQEYLNNTTNITLQNYAAREFYFFICTECEDDYFLNTQNNTCVSITSHLNGVTKNDNCNTQVGGNASINDDINGCKDLVCNNVTDEIVKIQTILPDPVFLCVASELSNCLTLLNFDENNSASETRNYLYCDQCNPGYIKFDGFCVPACKTPDTLTKECTECETGFTLDTYHKICLQTAPFYTGCEEVSNYHCVKCPSNQFLRYPRLNQTVDISSSNSITLSSTIRMEEFYFGFCSDLNTSETDNLDSLCQTFNFENHEKFMSNNWASHYNFSTVGGFNTINTFICVECKTDLDYDVEYYQGTCIPKGCEPSRIVYHSGFAKFQCDTCRDNYMLTSITNGSTYCEPMLKSQNENPDQILRNQNLVSNPFCNKFDVVNGYEICVECSFKTNADEVDKSIKDFYVMVLQPDEEEFQGALNALRTYCVEVKNYLIENCKKYSRQYSQGLSYNLPTCIQCEEGYSLSYYIPLNKLVTQCLEIIPNTAEKGCKTPGTGGDCDECFDDQQLDDDKQNCYTKLAGHEYEFCTQIDNNQNCQKCELEFKQVPYRTKEKWDYAYKKVGLYKKTQLDNDTDLEIVHIRCGAKKTGQLHCSEFWQEGQDITVNDNNLYFNEPKCLECRDDEDGIDGQNLFYELKNNTCLIKNCEQITDQYCYDCLSGFTPSYHRTSCVRKTIDFCLEYSFNGQNCLKCEGFTALYFNQGKGRLECVVTKIPGCIMPVNDITSQINEGITQKEFQDILSLPQYKNFSFQHCQEFGCDTFGGYQNPVDITLVENIFENCLPKHCETVNNKNGECTQCKNQYLISVDRMKCGLLIPNCMALDSTLINCFKCESGFGIFKNTDGLLHCEQFDHSLHPGCLTLDQQSNRTKKAVCKTCKEGLFLKDDLCQDPNCEELGTGNTCLRCKEDFERFGPYCYSQSDYKCLTYIDNNDNDHINRARSCASCDVAEDYVSLVRFPDNSFRCVRGTIHNCETYLSVLPQSALEDFREIKIHPVCLECMFKPYQLPKTINFGLENQYQVCEVLNCDDQQNDQFVGGVDNFESVDDKYGRLNGGCSKCKEGFSIVFSEDSYINDETTQLTGERNPFNYTIVGCLKQEDSNNFSLCAEGYYTNAFEQSTDDKEAFHCMKCLKDQEDNYYALKYYIQDTVQLKRRICVNPIDENLIPHCEVYRFEGKHFDIDADENLQETDRGEILNKTYCSQCESYYSTDQSLTDRGICIIPHCTDYNFSDQNNTSDDNNKDRCKNCEQDFIIAYKDIQDGSQGDKSFRRICTGPLPAQEGCESIEAESNFKDQSCRICMEGYAIIWKNNSSSCVKIDEQPYPTEYEIEFCKHYARKDWKGAKPRCLQCEDYYIPEHKEGGQYCIPIGCKKTEDLINAPYTEVDSQSQTKQFDFYKCEECEENHFSLVASSPEGRTLKIQIGLNYLDSLNQRCIPFSAFNNCKTVRFGYDLNKPVPTTDLARQSQPRLYQCEECLPDHGIFIHFNQNDIDTQQHIYCTDKTNEQEIKNCDELENRFVSELTDARPRCKRCTGEGENSLFNTYVPYKKNSQDDRAHHFCVIKNCERADTALMINQCRECETGFRFTMKEKWCVPEDWYNEHIIVDNQTVVVNTCEEIDENGVDCYTCATGYALYYDQAISYWRCMGTQKDQPGHIPECLDYLMSKKQNWGNQITNTMDQTFQHQLTIIQPICRKCDEFYANVHGTGEQNYMECFLRNCETLVGDNEATEYLEGGTEPELIGQSPKQLHPNHMCWKCKTGYKFSNDFSKCINIGNISSETNNCEEYDEHKDLLDGKSYYECSKCKMPTPTDFFFFVRRDTANQDSEADASIQGQGKYLGHFGCEKIDNATTLQNMKCLLPGRTFKQPVHNTVDDLFCEFCEMQELGLRMWNQSNQRCEPTHCTTIDADNKCTACESDLLFTLIEGLCLSKSQFPNCDNIGFGTLNGYGYAGGFHFYCLLCEEGYGLKLHYEIENEVNLDVQDKPPFSSQCVKIKIEHCKTLQNGDSDLIREFITLTEQIDRTQSYVRCRECIDDNNSGVTFEFERLDFTGAHEDNYLYNRSYGKCRQKTTQCKLHEEDICVKCQPDYTFNPKGDICYPKHDIQTALIYDNCLNVGDIMQQTDTVDKGQTCDTCNKTYHGIVIADNSVTDHVSYGCKSHVNVVHNCQKVLQSIYEKEVGDGKTFLQLVKEYPRCLSCKPGYEDGRTIADEEKQYCYINHCETSDPKTGNCLLCKDSGVNYKLASNMSLKTTELQPNIHFYEICADISTDQLNLTLGGIWLKQCEKIIQENVEFLWLQCHECKVGAAMYRGADDRNQCVLYADLTEEKEVRNCIEYNRVVQGNSNLELPQCKKCNPRYNLINQRECELNEVENCKEGEQIDSQGRCPVCKTGYFLSNDRRICLQIIVAGLYDYTNCEVAGNDTNHADCWECKDNYALVFSDSGNRHTCILKNISDCADVFNTTVISEKTENGDLVKYIANQDKHRVQRCRRCSVNYYRATSQHLECVFGKVPNCYDLQVSQQYLCNQCLDQFMRVSVKSTQHTCVDLTNHLKCKKPKLKGIETQLIDGMTVDMIQLECDTCEENQILTINSDFQSQQCLNLDLIINCQRYEWQDPVLLCRKCRSDFWLDASANLCKAVTQRAYCLTYEADSDKCSSCETTHILNSDGLSCLLIPSGEIKCDVYNSTGTICTRCKPGYYKDDNTCLKTTLIPNCAYYLQQNQCETCLSGSQLVQQSLELANGNVVLNYCFEKTIANCEVEEEGQQSCITCSSTHKKITENQKSTCQIPPNENCQEYLGETCIKCNQKYYIEAGACLEGDNIDHCLEWSSKTQCFKCSRGKTLTADRLSCSDGFNDSNCAHFQENNNQRCSLCSPGFYLDFSGNCVTITSQNSALNGCMIPDQSNRIKCSVCSPGYYMKDVGSCTEDLIIAPPPSGGDDSSQIMATLGLLILFFVLQ